MKYIAIAVVTFSAGVELGLSDAQARARAHALTALPKRKGWYCTSGPIQLKAGEEFYFDGDLPKGLADALEQQKKGRQALTKPSPEQLEAATAAVTAAQAELDAAADDAAKAAAQQKLDEATASLEAIKG